VADGPEPDAEHPDADAGRWSSGTANCSSLAEEIEGGRARRQPPAALLNGVVVVAAAIILLARVPLFRPGKRAISPAR